MQPTHRKKKYIFRIGAFLLVIIILGILSLYTNYVQNKVTRFTIHKLEKEWGVKINFGSIQCHLFSACTLNNITLFDKKNDTLLSLKSFSISVTDWFFWQKSPVINYIDIAELHLYPTLEKNNHYNFEFIQDYFKNSTDSPSSNNSSSFLNHWKINKINIKKLSVRFKNQVDSTEQNLFLKQFTLHVDSLNLTNKKLDMASIQCINPDLSLINHKRTPNLKPDQIQDIFNRSFKLPAFNYDVKVEKIMVTNFNVHQRTFQSDSNIYSTSNIVSNFNILIQHTQISKNELSTNFVSNGAIKNNKVRTFNFNLQVKNKVIALKNIAVETQHSKAFADGYLKINNPKNSNAICLKDIKYSVLFKPSIIHTTNILSILKLDHIISKEFIHIDGMIEGNYDFVQSNRLLIKLNNNNFVKSNFLIHHIFDTSNLNIFVKVEKSKGNFVELKKIFPILQNYQFTLGDSFGNFEFAGDLNYFKKAMVIHGLFNSNNGMISSNLKLNVSNKLNPSYTGELKTTNLNLGSMFNIKGLGRINFNGKIKGSGLSLDKLKADIEGNLDHFEYQKFNFNKVSVNGLIANKIYNGYVKIVDSLINLHGLVNINLNETLPQYSFDGRFDLLNLNIFQLATKDIKIQSNIKFNLKGHEWHNIYTTLNLDDIHLAQNDSFYHFDFIKVQADKVNAENFKYSFESDFIETNLTSSVPINIFVPNFKKIFFRYLTKFYQDTNTVINPNFSYTMTGRIKNQMSFMQMFDMPFSGFENTTLQTGFGANNPYYFHLQIPNIYFKTINATQFNVDISEINNALQCSLQLATLKINSNFILQNILYYSYLSNNKQLFNISTNNSTSLFKMSIQGIIDFLGKNDWQLKMNPSWIRIKNNHWVFDDKGTINYQNGLVDISNFNITNGDESVQLTSSSNFKHQQIDLILQFVNIHLDEILNLVIPKYNIKGTVDGNVYLHLHEKNLHANSLLNFHKLQIKNDSIGFVNTFIEFDSNYNIHGQILSNNPHYNFSAESHFNLLNKNTAPLETSIEMRDLTATILSPLLEDVFYGISGSMKGKLRFNGSLSKPIINGEIDVHKGSLGVLFSNVKYNFDTTKFIFKLNEIQIAPATIFDQQNNTAHVEGYLLHDYFNFFTYNINANSSKIMILNTLKNPYDYFYGTVYGNLDFKMTGNDDNLLFDITSTTLNNTNFFIQNITQKESFEDNLIKFSKGPSQITKSKDLVFHTKINYDLHLNIQNSSNINVVLDDVSNDVIAGNGTGSLHIFGSTLDPLSIQGIYNIEQGKYDINFQSLLKTTFVLQPNQNNFIEWTNKPLEANVNIEAVYKTQPVSLADLIGNASFSQNIKSYKGVVYIVATLKDKLNNPKIHFRLDFPPDAPILTNNDFNQFLRQLESNENEMLKQVGFLILFQSFAPIGNIAGNFNTEYYNYSNIGYNTLSKIISNQMNQILSSALSKITKDKTFSFDFGTSFYNSSNLISQNTGVYTGNSNTIDRNRVNIKVSKSFLNDKIVLSFDPGLDFNLGASTYNNKNVEFLPNFNIDLALTKDKKLKLILFSNSSLDYTGVQFGKRNRQGIRLSFQRDFN